MAGVNSLARALVVAMLAAKMSGVTFERSSHAAHAVIERASRPEAIRLSSD